MNDQLKQRSSEALRSALDMPPDEFREAGHRLIDTLADFYAGIADRPVTRADSVSRIRQVFSARELPQTGEAAQDLLARFTPLLIEHSLHNGHPRFLGYITSSAAPLGALADLLAAAINQNCGLRELSPAANEIERQTVDWLAELIGFPRPCGGVMVSGGNMANMLALFAARHARLPWPVRQAGLRAGAEQPIVYASQGTHTWLEKAADIAGIGTEAIRWVAIDRDHRLLVDDLERLVEADRAAGHRPFMVVGTAGTVSTGAVDPLPAIADIAARAGLWFHVDGAYGAPAAMLPEAPQHLKALARADSVALDPHKWLYNPIEAACTLVRDPRALSNALSYRPPYYGFEQDADDPAEQRQGVPADGAGGRIDSSAATAANYYEHSLQNTRAFRALKTWLCIQQAGRAGYTESIRRDIALARSLHLRAQSEPELEAGTQHLSITTFRFRPTMIDPGNEEAVGYLDRLNAQIVERLRTGGEVFVSNAVLDGAQFVRACVVNFRTREADIEAVVQAVLRVGREVHAAFRDSEGKGKGKGKGNQSQASSVSKPGETNKE